MDYKTFDPPSPLKILSNKEISNRLKPIYQFINYDEIFDIQRGDNQRVAGPDDLNKILTHKHNITYEKIFNLFERIFKARNDNDYETLSKLRSKALNINFDRVTSQRDNALSIEIGNTFFDPKHKSLVFNGIRNYDNQYQPYVLEMFPSIQEIYVGYDIDKDKIYDELVHVTEILISEIANQRPAIGSAKSLIMNYGIIPGFSSNNYIVPGYPPGKPVPIFNIDDPRIKFIE